MDVAVRNGLLAFLAPFLIYVLTAAPTIYNLDSAELTTAAATGGLMRATGYPLYLVLGKLWSLIPVGDLGYRMNLFSAFWGAVTIFLADYILKLLKVRSWARFGALGLLATAPYFWSLSLFAEVYTLHTALMAGIILALLRWGEDPGPARLGLVVFLLAISMGNHAATVLLLPGSLWYVGTRHPQELRRSANYLAVLLALILGGSVFLYLPWRYGANPPFNYAGIYDGSGTFQKVNLQTLDGFLWLVTGRTFSGQMFGYRLHELGSQALEFGNQLWLSFFAIGILPGLIGLFYGIKRNWRLGGMLVLMFVVNAVFFINYRVIDKETMFLPAFLVWAVWLGVGYQALLDWVGLENGARPHRRLLHAVLVGSVMLSFIWNWSRVNLSGDYSTREQSEAILEAVEPDGIIFGWWETIPAIQYLQLVEGMRPDVVAINRFLISGEHMNQLILEEIGKRPIYINNPSVELLRVTTVEKGETLYRLTEKQ